MCCFCKESKIHPRQITYGHLLNLQWDVSSVAACSDWIETSVGKGVYCFIRSHPHTLRPFLEFQFGIIGYMDSSSVKFADQLYNYFWNNVDEQMFPYCVPKKNK